MRLPRLPAGIFHCKTFFTNFVIGFLWIRDCEWEQGNSFLNLHNRNINYTMIKTDSTGKMTNFRWVVCSLLFVALVINYLDRQVLSLTWKNFISPEFGWTDADYGRITGVFSIVYAVGMLFAGKVVDYMGTKKGYLWAIGIWSVGACLHAFCGVLTNGIVAGDWTLSFSAARANLEALRQFSDVAVMITTVSVWLFLTTRCVLAIGEAGNFPCSIKAIAEYFPKKDRGFATGVFNAGSQIGALLAPFTIPVIAKYHGWEAAFLYIGFLGFLWMGFWVFIYRDPRHNPHVNAAELAYIEQDNLREEHVAPTVEEPKEKVGVFQAFTFRQTWAVIFGRFLPDSVWWFLLFWAPAFISDVYGYSTASATGMLAIFTIYFISMLSLWGSYLPTFFINRNKLNPYAGRMKAMLIYALFPLVGIGVMPLGEISMWYPVVIIGVVAAAHQSWSANVYNVVSDMFPKSVVATVIGAAGLASGLGSFMSNYGAGQLFDYAARTNMQFLGFEGKNAGYMIIFLCVGVAYLFSWCMMKLLVPKYKLVVLKNK
ncbi:MAG: MFS transporter [Bacteroidales bacterium]|nr:MFS transporter [Bacteroidales bacterium]